MSYILDALVKADLERKRQEVPGLHTVQSVLPPRESMYRPWLAGAAGALAVAGLAFLAWGRPWSGPLPAAAPPAALEQGLPSPMPSTALSLPTDPGVPPLPLVAAQPPRPAVSVRESRRETTAASRIDAVTEERKPRPGSRLYDIAELPPDLQKEARKLTVAGYAQVSDSGEPVAIINDRAWGEGDEVAKGLKVERISDGGVTFSLKGYRFRKGGS